MSDIRCEFCDKNAGHTEDCPNSDMLPVAPPSTPEKPKRKRRKRTVAVVLPKPPVVEQQTVEQRLAATKAKARQLAHEQSVRIPLRLGVSLELHEGLVAIAEAVGPAKIPAVAVRCMEIGVEQWGRQLRVNHVETQPNIHAAMQRDAILGNDADRERAQAAIDAAVAKEAQIERQVEAERDEAASKLHLPGRRRAAAG